MNVYIFSYPINNFKILLKSSHNIESVLFFFNFSVTQVTSQPYSIHSISPTFRTCLKRPLQNKKFTWQCELNPNNQFFYLTKRKKYLCSEQLKQPFYSLIHSKMIETCYEDTTQTTTFWILAETFYIAFTFYNFNNQFIGWKWKTSCHSVQMKELKQP